MATYTSSVAIIVERCDHVYALFVEKSAGSQISCIGDSLYSEDEQIPYQDIVLGATLAIGLILDPEKLTTSIITSVNEKVISTVYTYTCILDDHIHFFSRLFAKSNRVGPDYIWRPDASIPVNTIYAIQLQPYGLDTNYLLRDVTEISSHIRPRFDISTLHIMGAYLALSKLRKWKYHSVVAFDDIALFKSINIPDTVERMVIW